MISGRYNYIISLDKCLSFLICIGLILSISCQKVNYPGQASIGYKGGTVLSLDGKLKLTIPPGAVSINTEFRILEINSQNELYPTTGIDGRVIGKYYIIEPYETEFLKPVHVEFNYKSYLNSINNPENLGIQQLAESKGFVNVIGADNNTETKVISFFIDQTSTLKLAEFGSKCSYLSFYWNTKVIKWYMDTPSGNSYLNESNVIAALKLWQNETSSFIFEKVALRSEANLIFTELYDKNEFSNYTLDYHIFEKTGGMTTFESKTTFDRIRIFLASDDINLAQAKRILVHEVGHALGIAHTIRKELVYSVMSDSFEGTWDGKLSQNDIDALHENYALNADDKNQMRLETLLENLEYPNAITYKNDKLYYTESAAGNTVSGGRKTLNVFDLLTFTNTLLAYPDFRDALVIIDDKIFHSSYSYSIPGESGQLWVYDLNNRTDKFFLNVSIATEDMCSDSFKNFYLLGSSDKSTAKSLYKFSPPDYSSPTVLLTGLGRTLSITEYNNNLYYTDYSAIWKIDGSLQKTLFYMKPGISGLVITDKYLYYTDLFNNRIGRIELHSQTSEIIFDNIPYPCKMTIDRENHAIFFLSQGTAAKNFKDGRILKISNIE